LIVWEFGTAVMVFTALVLMANLRRTARQVR